MKSHLADLLKKPRLGTFKRPTLFFIKGLTVWVGLGKPMDLCVCVSEERGNAEDAVSQALSRHICTKMRI
jgi:hypothetical protein